MPMASLTADQVPRVLGRVRGVVAAAPWNRHRAARVLALDVEELDVRDRRGRHGEGDAWVTWRSGMLSLLARLVAGRTQGPVFLTERRPSPAGP